MNFAYNSRNHLCAGAGLARERDLTELCQNYTEPFYVYDMGHMAERTRLWQQTFPGVHHHYAVKANAHLEVLRAFKGWGCKVDVVSGGEIERAREAGFSGSDMIFSGVGKSEREIRLSLEFNLKQINIESPQELERVGRIAQAMGKKARVAFRMNPDVEAHTHPYITTGMRENKFGMDETFLPELLEILARYPQHLELQGLTLHIGSQLQDLAPLEAAIAKTIPVWHSLKAQGFHLTTFDFGGGLGIQYTTGEEHLELDLARRYGEIVTQYLKPLQAEILCEPGRFLVARAGALITQVQYIKRTRFKSFCIVDAGINALLRPALYQAYHRIVPLVREAGRPLGNYDVVGPICESSDCFAKDRELPELRQGEWIALLDAGAYGASMASQYNLHPLPREIVLS